jgi:mRNA interferase RelE/StbE
VKFRVEKSFDQDVDRIKDKSLLRKLQTFISAIETAEALHGIPHIKKLEGYASFYRIKNGSYRLGLEAISQKEVILRGLLHRKDIYRYFPKRG